MADEKKEELLECGHPKHRHESVSGKPGCFFCASQGRLTVIDPEDVKILKALQRERLRRLMAGKDDTIH